MAKNFSLIGFLEKKIIRFEKNIEHTRPKTAFIIKNIRRGTLLFLGLVLIDIIVAFFRNLNEQSIVTFMGLKIQIISQDPLRYRTTFTINLLWSYLIVIIVWFLCSILLRYTKKH